MITVYRADGSSEVINAPLIEVSSLDGHPALFIARGEQGEIRISRPGDEEFDRMCSGLGKTPARIIQE